MSERDKTDDDDAAREASADGGVGDVETAGETTAVATITGPPPKRPVGADTMVKVADTPKENESDVD